jgi:polar amino acid transport system substrate-binding protein
MHAAWIVALALAGLSCKAGSADQRPVVRACGHHHYPPWNWQRGPVIDGVCAVVAQRALERLGYRVDLSYAGPWKRCQQLVASGAMDVNICAFRNPERETYSLFVEPRMGQNRIGVFVRKERAPGITLDPEWKALSGMRTGLVLGVSMGAKFDEFLEANTSIERVTQVGQAMKMLAIDRIDIVPFGWEAGLIELERTGLGDEIVPLAQPALVGDLWISVSKRSPLASRVNEIGEYLSREAYRAELASLFKEYQQLAIDEAWPPGTASGRPR